MGITLRSTVARALKVLVFIVAGYALPPQADAAPEGVPAVLAPWADWISFLHPEWRCAMGGEDAPICVFPALLTYRLEEDTGSFTAEVDLLDRGSIVLPSGTNVNPSDITITDDKGGPVAPTIESSNGELRAILPAGHYVITGTLRWNEPHPKDLPAPAGFGIISVLDAKSGAPLPFTRNDGSIRLEEREHESSADSVTLSVMRRLRDGSPLTIDTLIRIRVSGRARPLNLGAVVPEGDVPVSISARMPHHLSPDGRLALQLTPGEFDVRITSVHGQPVTSIALPKPTSESWPRDEIWSWVPNAVFRSVELQGADSVHAELTQLPDDWKGGAVFSVRSGGKVQLRELRRGEQSSAPNEISLNRDMWVDFDGTGLTVVDRFNGTMNNGFRLDTQPSMVLGRASVDFEPQLITDNPKTGARGVELRNQQVQVEAVSRIQGLATIPAIGWNIPVRTLSASLNLPPSWKLLHVQGGHESTRSWLGSWTLLDVFIDVLIVVAAFKLFGGLIAALLALSLALNHGEHLEPKIFFIHLVLLAMWRAFLQDDRTATARLCRLLIAVTYVVWALQGLAFGKLQLTQLLFPQLPAGTRFRTLLQSLLLCLESNLFSWPLLLLCVGLIYLGVRSIIRPQGIWRRIFKVMLFGFLFLVCFSVFVGTFAWYAFEGGSVSSASFSGAYAPPAPAARGKGVQQKQEAYYDLVYQSEPAPKKSKALQSGPAVPAWNWHRYYISFDGPVAENVQLRLYLLPPGINRVLSGVRLVVILLLIILMGRGFGYGEMLRRIRTRVPRSALAGFALLSVLSGGDARADFPPQSMLEQLEARMARDRCTAERCAVIESLEITLEDQRFTMKLRASSNGVAVVPLPGPLDVLQPSEITLNGSPRPAVRRSSGNFLEARTQPGTNLFEITGELPRRPAFSLQFRDRPLVTKVSTTRWFVEGLLPSGAVPDALRFTDRAAAASGNDALSGKQVVLPTWFAVDRSILVGEQTSVRTVVTRMGSQNAPARVRIPLFEGERILSGSVTVEQDHAYVTIPQGVGETGFSSVIPSRAQFMLTLKEAPMVSERWKLQCESYVACRTEGIRPTQSVTDGRNQLLWDPFPGEQVTIFTNALAASKGEYVTVDSVNHSIERGASVLTGRINVQLRATAQGAFGVTLEPGSVLKRVTLDNEAGSGSSSGDTATVLLNPGPHSVEVEYDRPANPAAKQSVPAVELTAPAHNVTITVQPARDRWLIWTDRGYFGPSVLFWSKLVFLAIAMVMLAQVGLLPFGNVNAVIFAFGMSLLPIVLLCVPVAWLIILVVLPGIRPRLVKLPRFIYLLALLSLTFVSLTILYAAVYSGLVEAPPILVAGNNSSSWMLRWFMDHAGTKLPTPWTLSAPLWTWRLLTLAWSTWLVLMLVGWVKRTVEAVRPYEVTAENTEKEET